MSSLPTSRFFLPGPTEVRREVLEAMLRPMIGHRVPEMEELMGRIQPRLQKVFQTERPVYVAPASGTGMMEAGVRNGAIRRVLSLTNGAFSERFMKIAEANGLHVEALALEWGEAHTPEMLEEALAGDDFDTVTICHSETSTGALNPINELARVAHEAGDIVVLIDSVSGLSGAPVLTDRWQLDFVLTGSQKSFALPPGLAFGVAQVNVLERAAKQRSRGIYFDFIEYERNILKNQTPNTPAISLLFALDRQLELMLEEGIENRWKRHLAMAQATYGWVAAMRDRGHELSILAPEGYRSPTVTTIRCPEGWTGPGVVAAAKGQGFDIASGYGKLRDSTFRIGHMGEHTVAGVGALLDALTDVFEQGPGAEAGTTPGGARRTQPFA
ncbi:MAG: pyridoxal-phosphate-dependent aminotransferase family protein [Longimicrobiales bacterium]